MCVCCVARPPFFFFSFYLDGEDDEGDEDLSVEEKSKHDRDPHDPGGKHWDHRREAGDEAEDEDQVDAAGPEQNVGGRHVDEADHKAADKDAVHRLAQRGREFGIVLGGKRRETLEAVLPRVLGEKKVEEATDKG